MNQQIWIIFLMMASLQSLNSQIEDDFFSNDQILDENWMGDRSKFVINSENQLQLNDTGSGTATLFQKTVWAESMTWEMYLMLDFSPSNSNRLEVQLWSDNADWSISNGYSLRIGENGSNDAFQLMLNEQGRQTEVASGSLGSLAEDPVEVRIKMNASGGFFLLEADFQGGICFETEIEVSLETPDIGADIYFGWQTNYTSTRSDKFFFDDIYVGSERLDTMAPRIDEIQIFSSNVNFNFNEPMETASINDAKITLTPLIPELDIEFEKTELTIISDVFDNQITYSISFDGLLDLAGNSIDTTIEFVVPKTPDIGDLLINEVLFNPKSTGADYIEVYNNSNSLIGLGDVKVSNQLNSDVVALQSIGKLAKNEYVVITRDKNNIVESFSSIDPTRIFQLDIPRLNNDDGNVTILLGDIIIDEFDYDDNMHQRLLDDVDGISLERISFDKNSNERLNWTSALASAGFGTPGIKNSVVGVTSQNGNRIELQHKVFSPNGDGDKDVMEINYVLASSGYVGTVRIFNESGSLVNTLLSNEILPSSGNISWTGNDQNGQQASIGIYIVHVSLFNLEGGTIEKKFSVGLGNFLN